MAPEICTCGSPESFMDLARSLSHWEFEFMLMVIFDGLIGAIAWPMLKKHWGHHLARDQKENVK